MKKRVLKLKKHTVTNLSREESLRVRGGGEAEANTERPACFTRKETTCYSMPVDCTEIKTTTGHSPCIHTDC